MTTNCRAAILHGEMRRATSKAVVAVSPVEQIGSVPISLSAIHLVGLTKGDLDCTLLVMLRARNCDVVDAAHFALKAH